MAEIKGSITETLRYQYRAQAFLEHLTMLIRAMTPAEPLRIQRSVTWKKCLVKVKTIPGRKKKVDMGPRVLRSKGQQRCPTNQARYQLRSSRSQEAPEEDAEEENTEEEDLEEPEEKPPRRIKPCPPAPPPTPSRGRGGVVSRARGGSPARGRSSTRRHLRSRS